MPLPSSGSISASQINVELGNPAETQLSLGDTAVRSLAAIQAGLISFADLFGKSNQITFINTVNRTGASIHELMGSPTQASTYIFENRATISGGGAGFALRTGTFPAGSTLRIVNIGTIQGSGGSGSAVNTAGNPGGTALYVDYNCTIENAGGYILGSGGGGGAAYFRSGSAVLYATGGGGSGSPGGAVGGATSGGTLANTQPTAGSPTAGGAGGRAHSGLGQIAFTVWGGAGGDLGAAGAAGTYSYYGVSNPSVAVYAGGAAGPAIAVNGNSVAITSGNNTTQIKGAVA